MYKNQKEKTMSFCTTPMNLNKRSNEKSRKTHRSIGNKSIQKCTSLNGNSVKMRDGLDRVTRNSEKQIIELGKLMGCDMRISTPIDSSTSDERHNVINRKGLSVRVHNLIYQRCTKSRGHYCWSNDILVTLYPTPHILSVGINRVDREVRIELSNQSNSRMMLNL